MGNCTSTPKISTSQPQSPASLPRYGPKRRPVSKEEYEDKIAAYHAKPMQEPSAQLNTSRPEPIALPVTTPGLRRF